MTAYGLLNITARVNQPFTHVTQPWCSKQCFTPLRHSVRRKCNIVCGSTIEQLPVRRVRQACSHRSQVADQAILAEQQTAQRRGSSALLLAVALAVGNVLLQSAPAIALTIHQEPENALSFPTWVIHISSVIEWAIAMSLVWKYAEVTGTINYANCLPAAHCMLLNACQLYCQLSRQCALPMKVYLFVALCMFPLLCVKLTVPMPAAGLIINVAFAGSGNAKWKGLTWGMMPLLGGALCACTYHFFYNSSDLDFLVAVQASLTWIGNATCAAAAYRIYKSAQQEGAA